MRKVALAMAQVARTDRQHVAFVLHKEHHSLGNCLQFMIKKDLEMEFCGQRTQLICLFRPGQLLQLLGHFRKPRKLMKLASMSLSHAQDNKEDNP